MPYVNLPIHVIPDLGKSQFKACIRFNFQSKWEMIHEKWRFQTKTWAIFIFPYFLLTSKRFICDKDKGVEFDLKKTRRQKQMDEFRRERTNFSANSIRRKFLEAEWTNWKTTKTLPFVQICGWSVGWGKSFNFLFSLSEIMAAVVLSFTLVTSFLWSQLVAILLLMGHRSSVISITTVGRKVQCVLQRYQWAKWNTIKSSGIKT